MAREVTLADIKFEQASVLYNIGALHSILGSMETRTNADVNKFNTIFCERAKTCKILVILGLKLSVQIFCWYYQYM